jgi:hypothetical protein
LEITQEQANDLTRGCVTPSSPDRPYLLRALEVEGPPGSHTEVSIFLKTTGDLLVGMETSDTPIRVSKRPYVVTLPSKPERVYLGINIIK